MQTGNNNTLLLANAYGAVVGTVCVPPAAPVQATTPATTPSKAKGPGSNGGKLTPRNVLALLQQHGGTLTTPQMRILLGVQKGWAALMGAATKGGSGGLLGAGYVVAAPVGNAIAYTITPKGAAWLAAGCVAAAAAAS